MLFGLMMVAAFAVFATAAYGGEASKKPTRGKFANFFHYGCDVWFDAACVPRVD